MRIKLKIPRKSKQNPKTDITALRKPAIRDEFELKVKNKYDCLMEESCKQIPEEQGRKRQNEWGAPEDRYDSHTGRSTAKEKEKSQAALDDPRNTGSDGNKEK